MLSRLIAALAIALLISPAQAEKRVALVIGNSIYAHADTLRNPKNDAQDVSAAFQRIGFETIVGLDLNKAEMDEKIIQFARKAREADVAAFYYAGHSMQFAGSNYLMPVDALLSDEADLRRLTKVDDIVADLQQAKSLRILVLDSCRDNPIADLMKRTIGLNRSVSVQRGLARMNSPQGMIVAYATQAGSTAADGVGRNSPYTAAFLKQIERPEEIGTVFRRISADVYTTTRQQQLPELSLSLIGEFYLGGQAKAVMTPAAAPEAPLETCAGAEAHWRNAEAVGSRAALEDHVARFPICSFAGLAKARLAAMVVARLEPPATAPMTDVPVTKPSPPIDVAQLLQVELRRVGCNVGPIQAGWTVQARQGLELFNKYTGMRLDAKTASLDALTVVRDRTSRVCPLVCQRGYAAQDDRCVKLQPAESRKKIQPADNNRRKVQPADNRTRGDDGPKRVRAHGDAATESLKLSGMGTILTGQTVVLTARNGRKMTCVGGSIARGVARKCHWH